MMPLAQLQVVVLSLDCPFYAYRLVMMNACQNLGRWVALALLATHPLACTPTIPGADDADTPSGPTALTLSTTSWQPSIPAGLTQTTTIDVTGHSGEITASVSGANWLTVDIEQDTQVATITLALDALELEPGDYAAELEVTDSDANQAVLLIDLNVTDQEAILFTPATLALSIPQGLTEEVPLTVWANTGSPAFLLTRYVTWLELSAEQGAGPLGLTAVIDASGLIPGTYDTEVVASAERYAESALTVDLTVLDPQPGLAIGTVTQNTHTGDTYEIETLVTTSAPTNDRITVTSDQPWLSAHRGGYYEGDTARITVDVASLPDGLNVGTLTMSGAGYTTATTTFTFNHNNSPHYLTLGMRSEESAVDIGWKGEGFGLRLPDNARITLGVSCTSTSAPFTDCTITGPVSNALISGQAYGNNRRCRTRPHVECTSEADCSGGCVYFVAAPVPVVNGGIEVCAVASVSTLTGSVDISTGEARTSAAPLMVDVWSATACPDCVGGVCSAGPRVGLACSSPGQHLLGTTSLDCPAQATTPDESLTARLPPMTTESNTTWTVTQSSPDCWVGEGKCLCGVCRDNATIGCASGADCVAAGAGNTCRSAQARAAVCMGDDACEPIVGDRGQCGLGRDGLEDTISSQACSGDASVTCSGDNLVCQDHNLGTCSTVKWAGCWTNLSLGAVGGTLTAESRVTSEDAVLLGTPLCLPESTSGSINSNLGLPGPGRLQLSWDPDVVYQ